MREVIPRSHSRVHHPSNVAPNSRQITQLLLREGGIRAEDRPVLYRRKTQVNDKEVQEWRREVISIHYGTSQVVW